MFFDLYASVVPGCSVGVTLVFCGYSGVYYCFITVPECSAVPLLFGVSLFRIPVFLVCPWQGMFFIYFRVISHEFVSASLKKPCNFILWFLTRIPLILFLEITSKCLTLVRYLCLSNIAMFLSYFFFHYLPKLWCFLLVYDLLL